MKDLQPGDLIEVTWDDATGDSSWVQYDSIEWPVMSCRTVGYFMRKDARAIMLADSMFDDFQEAGGQVGGLNTIPAPWVTSIRRLSRRRSLYERSSSSTEHDKAASE